MHRFAAGACRMELRLTPQGPWMVRGEKGRSLIKTKDGLPLLPASSIKGVLRSTAERILRTVDVRSDPERIPLADDPFAKNDTPPFLPRSQVSDSTLVKWNQHTGRYTDKQLAPEQIYALLSASTQLFGATTHAGLLTLTDAHGPATATAPRSHIAIDRFTGGVGQSLFTDQLVQPRPLQTSLTVTNFALWQIGLLALVFQEIDRGYVGFGGGTHKGQGQMRVEVTEVAVTYNGAIYNTAAGIISAQARLADPPWLAHSEVPEAVAAERGVTLLAGTAPEPASDWRGATTHRFRLDGAQAKQLLREAVRHPWQAWVKRMLGGGEA